MTSLIFLPVLTGVIDKNESLVCENQEEGTETIFLLDIDFTADKRGAWNHKTPFSSL